MLRRLVPLAVLAVAPLAVPLAVVPLAAQAPRITPKGDPSVRADSIYRLAVDPAAYPEDAAVFLLDDGVTRFEADGRSVRTYRQIVQILKPEAAEQYQEQSFSYSPGHERLTINWIRVVKPDGTVISAAPTHVQDADIPAQIGNPVYTDQKVRRVSLSGVAPGTIVDYSYTTENLKPFLAGDFYTSWSISTGLPVRRSRLVLDLPSGLAARIKETNLTFKPTTVEANGRIVRTWAAADLPRVKPEPFAADSDGVYMHLAAASPLGWQDVARWYAGNAKGRYALGPTAAAKLREVVAGARTRDDTLRAVHKWVAQDVRYVSIDLGLGGYQPRLPEEVVRTGYGDCKDKATLFVAALGALGIEAYPVLLSSSATAERDLPSINQFDHAIAAFRRDGGFRFVDLTASLTPFGELPPSEQGGFALVVHPDGAFDEVTLPVDSIQSNRSEARILGVLSPTGRFTGRYEESGFGSQQYDLRSAFEHPFDSVETSRFAKGLARRFFPGADGDSVVAFDGKDLLHPARVSVRILDGRATRSSGDTELLQLPFANGERYAAGAISLEELLEREPRRFPIDASKVTGDDVLVQEFRVTLPRGWRARLPKSVTAKSVFGEYSSQYAQEGAELRVTRRFVGARGIYAPERIKELVEWFRAVGEDDAKFVVLDKS